MARTIEDIEQDIDDARQDVENTRSFLTKYPGYREQETLATLQQRITKLQKLESELAAAKRRS